jgi:hypothetical protein
MSNIEKFEATDTVSATIVMANGIVEQFAPCGIYTANCVRDGVVIWEDVILNTIPDNGKKLLLDTILGNSAGGAVVMGLKGTGSAATTDTQASHAGWLEVGLANAPTYSGTRKTPTFSAASGTTTVSKVTSSAVSFGITSSGTVAGCFINLAGSSTIDNTTGTLLSVGDFSGGSRSVINGDTVNVTYTLQC